MNAAFLLVTTAWLAGDYHAIQPVSGCTGPNCGAACVTQSHSYCDPCCDPCAKKPGLLDRIRGMFKKNDDCCCDPCPVQCCNPSPPTCHQSCAPTCHDPCCPTDCCDPCAKKPGLLDRLRGMFKKKDDCCCDPCACNHGHYGCGAAVHHHGHMPKADKEPEKLELPEKKKGNEQTSNEPPMNEVRITTPSPYNPTITAPREFVPNAQAATRNPF